MRHILTVLSESHIQIIWTILVVHCNGLVHRCHFKVLTYINISEKFNEEHV